MDGMQSISDDYPDMVLFKRTRTRQPRLTFNRYGQLECRLPRRYPSALAKLFISHNSVWIEKHRPARPKLIAGQYIADYRIVSEDIPLEDCYIDHDHQRLIVGTLEQSRFILPIEWKRAVEIITFRSKPLILGRYDSLSLRHRLRADRLSIRGMVSRWGSCTPDRHIAINCLAAQVPLRLLDYLILHEMAHLVHLNHGRQFYQLLVSLDPAAALHRKQLKRLPITIICQPSPAPWAVR